MELFTITGQIVDVDSRDLFPGCIKIANGRIVDIQRENSAPDRVIAPGFIDAHVHIESSLLIPSEFARLAVIHGTVGSVSDPHEIANVLGVPGVQFMIRNGAETPFYFCWGAPSCVPATEFETAGAELGVEQVGELLQLEKIRYLSEVMNYPGVLCGDPKLLAKISIARELDLPVDGHCPTLVGSELQKYIDAGVQTDHESFTLAEGEEKLDRGMKILLREGSAAKNLDELLPLMKRSPENCMFCTDDCHASYLDNGHINKLILRATEFGIEFVDAILSATLNPITHYGMDAGLLRVGDNADLVVIPDVGTMDVEATYIKGQKVADEHKTKLSRVPIAPINNFTRQEIRELDIQLSAEGRKMRVIRVIDGQLYTECEIVEIDQSAAFVAADLDRDLLKLVVVNRYDPLAKPAVCFVKGVGLKRGAFAQSVAHDSHNIIATGVDDTEIVAAVNTVIRSKGGLAVVDNNEKLSLPLPVAGLMSTEEASVVARVDRELDVAVKELGSELTAPFISLSFLALPVIPRLKLSDKGLFDGEKFKLISPFLD